jgi:riboflavin transporter FmnP
MNAKEVATCSIFTATAIALDQVRIPTLPGQVSFYFWEIPIVIALLLFGFKLGLTVAVLSSIGQALIFPRPLGFLAPIWNLTVMLSTLVGVALAQKFITWKTSRTPKLKEFKIKPVAIFTSSTLACRLALTPFVNYFMYKYMMPIMVGPSFSDAQILMLMPGLLAFDTILVLYTVPTSHIVAKTVNKNLRMGNTLV